MENDGFCASLPILVSIIRLCRHDTGLQEALAFYTPAWPWPQVIEHHLQLQILMVQDLYYRSPTEALKEIAFPHERGVLMRFSASTDR